MKPLRVAVIGAGSFCRTRHLPSLLHMRDVELAGVCDRADAPLREAERVFPLRKEALFDDYRRMLDTVRPDAVYAIMPPHHLFDLALEILDRGLPLFIEKPPGISTVQAESLARAATRRRLVTAVAFQRRYHPLVRACWDKVREGRRIHRIRVNYHKLCGEAGAPPYFGGAIDILRCDAIHAVDAVRFYSGLSPVASVDSLCRSIGTDYLNCYQALIRFENGSAAVLEADWASGRRFFTFEFHARGACAQVDLDGAGAVWLDNAQEPAFASDVETAAGSREEFVAGGFLAENLAFLDAVRSGVPPHNRLEDAVETMRLADAIEQAGRRGNVR